MKVTQFSYTVETVNDGGLRQPKRNPTVAIIETVRTEDLKEGFGGESDESHEESNCDVEDNESVNRIA